MQAKNFFACIDYAIIMEYPCGYALMCLCRKESLCHIGQILINTDKFYT